MNHQDRTEIEKVDEKVELLGIRVGNCEGGIEKIVTNHLPHMQDKLNMTFRVITWGLAGLAVMIAGLGILLVVVSQ